MRVKRVKPTRKIPGTPLFLFHSHRKWIEKGKEITVWCAKFGSPNLSNDRAYVVFSQMKGQ